jgi:hypothetical protein
VTQVRSPKEAFLTRYMVNVLVDNGREEGAPVIYEDNPTYQTLIGRTEHVAQMGTLLTDFSLIKPGAMLAHGRREGAFNGRPLLHLVTEGGCGLFGAARCQHPVWKSNK